MRRDRNIRVAIALLAGTAWSAQAQTPRDLEPPPSRTEPVGLDSGWHDSPSANEGREVLWSGTVFISGARWLRLSFSELVLTGDPARDDAAVLRLTSMEDGAVQVLDAESARRWSNTSAYFNGEAVFVELLGGGGSAEFGPSRVVIAEAVAGEPPFATRSICGPTDDRALSNDPKVARYLPSGCTAWLINDVNKQFLAAGHCGISSSGVCQFNVPLSNADGSLRQPPPEDQYPVEPTSIQAANVTVGDDWAYFGCWPNTTTNQSAFQRQGETFALAPTVAGPAGDTIRITGFGTTTSPVPPSWNQAQKTHTGQYVQRTGTVLRYNADTTGGNSGSAVLNETTGFAIGIHTNGGCTTGGGTNSGTSLDNPGLRAALASPRGICSPGFGVLVPPVFAAGDSARAFGTVSYIDGTFSRVSATNYAIDGMAYDANRGVFWACTTDRILLRIDPETGVATVVNTLQGSSRAAAGLAYDPFADRLYGITQVGGRLLSIDMTTATVAPVGGPGGNNVGALDFDTHTRTIYGIDDSSSGSRLIRIDAVTGVQTVVGLLGSGIFDCNGLAYNPADRQLYTILASTEQLFRINPATGAATAVGATSSLWGANFGLAAIGDLPELCPADFNRDGFVDFFDYDAFVGCFEGGPCGPSSADFNRDDFVDFFDYMDFVVAFEAGC
jgi:V8-like Glu-specific endopeptidase